MRVIICSLYYHVHFDDELNCYFARYYAQALDDVDALVVPGGFGNCGSEGKIEAIRYVRENKNNVCPTLTANMGMGGHNVPIIRDSVDIRKLTPRECARFQGYPDSFVLPDDLPASALYKKIGKRNDIKYFEDLGENEECNYMIITSFNERS